LTSGSRKSKPAGMLGGAIKYLLNYNVF